MPGLFGNVQSSAETGAIGWYEIALRKAGRHPWAEFVPCGGDCNAVERVALTPTPDGFRFDHMDRAAQADGSTRPAITRVRLRQAGRCYEISGRSVFPSERERLCPLTRRVGLAIPAAYGR